jgi:hypothetical protein
MLHQKCKLTVGITHCITQSDRFGQAIYDHNNHIKFDGLMPNDLGDIANDILSWDNIYHRTHLL